MDDEFDETLDVGTEKPALPPELALTDTDPLPDDHDDLPDREGGK